MHLKPLVSIRNSYLVKVNNRKILSGFLETIGISGAENEGNVLRIIDKIDKIGVEGISFELGRGRKDSSGALIPGLGIDPSIVKKIGDYFEQFTEEKSRSEIIENLSSLNSGNEKFTEGVDELIKIDNILQASGYDEKRVLFSPAIVRGLGYYTGPVYEVESLLTLSPTAKETSEKLAQFVVAADMTVWLKGFWGLKFLPLVPQLGLTDCANCLCFRGMQMLKQMRLS
jgi:histidyl-tRNA synthetase